MPFYLYENEYGKAVICATNQNDALKQLQTKEDFEHNGTWISLGAKAEDFKLLWPLNRGVIAYFRDN